MIDKLIRWADENNLSELEHKEHPIISGGYFKGFPRDKETLIGLHTLNLSKSGLITLPKEIVVLKNLKKLWLADNNLKSLPNEVCNLTLLEELYIPNNKINSLPQEIGKLSNLREINFENNNIKCLPVSLVLLKYLRKIDFRGQKHKCRVSSPEISSLILHGCLDDNYEFRNKLSMQNDNDWENFKKKLRNIRTSDITISVNGQKISYYAAIERIYGIEIADAQKSLWFFDIAKF